MKNGVSASSFEISQGNRPKKSFFADVRNEIIIAH